MNKPPSPVNPAVSVIMAAYNEEKHVREAIDSILNQTFNNLELIVVDDASTDQTPALLLALAQRDPRLRVITNTENKGRSFSRNRAIQAARANVLAIMDADDFSVPERLQTQWDFMRQHPEVDICGTALTIIEDKSLLRKPCTNSEIRAALLFECCMAHPSLLLKKETVLTAGYDETIPVAEDYHLWLRLCTDKRVTFANLEKPLLHYRQGEKRPDSPYILQQNELAHNAKKILLNALGLTPTEEEFRFHKAFSGDFNLTTDEEIPGCLAWLEKIQQANAAVHLFDEEILHKELCHRWYRLYLRRYSASFRHASRYFFQPFARYDLKTILKVLRRPLRQRRHRASPQTE